VFGDIHSRAPSHRAMARGALKGRLMGDGLVPRAVKASRPVGAV
jgi:hypothetical protein